MNLIFVQDITSQDLKNYTGSFGQIFKSEATADYEYYYDANSERIYNGKFKLTTKNNSIITGQYLNNKRVGYWKISRNEKDIWPIDNTECYGNYIDGKKNGDWTYKFNFDFNKKTYVSIYSLTFKNDTIVGKLDLMKLDKSYKDYLTGTKGEFDENSFITGAWEISKTAVDDIIIEFHKGFLVKYIVRNKQDGAFSEKFIPNKELLIKKIDELYKNNIEITHLGDAVNYQQYDHGTYGKEFGYIRFLPLNDIIEKDLRKIIGSFSTDLIPFEKNIYNKKEFYYKEPKILFRRINTDRGSEVYLPTVE